MFDLKTGMTPVQMVDKLQVEVVELKEQLNEIYNLFNIGVNVRNISVLLTNIENSKRRSECLGTIESIMSYKELDEEENEYLESLLNWGEDAETYKNTFIKALEHIQADAFEESINIIESCQTVAGLSLVEGYKALRERAEQLRNNNG